MPEHLVKIEILQQDDVHPDKFWVREADGANMSPEARDFRQLEENMKEHFESEHTPQMGITNPSRKIYIARCGRRNEEKKWRRVRVTDVFPSKVMKMTTCFLLDYVEYDNVQSTQLREAPESFLRVPFQAKKCSLHNLIPLRLFTDSDTMSTSLQASVEWDTSAVTFLSKKVKASAATKASFYGNKLTDSSPVRLYVQINHVYECVNDMMVEHDYAQEGDLWALRIKVEEMKNGTKTLKSAELPRKKRTLPAASGSTSESEHGSRSQRSGEYSDIERRRGSGRRPKSNSGHSSDSYGEMPPLESTPPRYPNLVEPVKMEKLDRKLAQMEQNNGHSFAAPSFAPVIREKLEVPDIPTIYLPESVTRAPGMGRGQILLNRLRILPLANGGGDSEREDVNGEAATKCTPTPTPIPTVSRPVERQTKNLLITEQDSASENEVMNGLRPAGRGIIKSLASEQITPPGLSVVAGRSNGPKSVSATSESTQKLAAISRGRGSVLKFLPTPPGSSVEDMNPGSSVEESNGRISPVLRPTSSSQPSRSAVAKGRGLASKLIQEIASKPNAPRPLNHEQGQFSDNEDIWEKGQGDGKTSSSSSQSGRVRFSDIDEVREIPGRSTFLPSSSSPSEQGEAAQDIVCRVDLMGALRLSKPGMYDSQTADDVCSPESHRVLYHGARLPPAMDLEQMPFAALMKRVLSPQENITVRSVQMYTWPAINRGKDTVGVATGGGGKTTAYLLPLAKQLEMGYYDELPPSCGPIICVLCSTWLRAQHVYDMAGGLLSHVQPTRAHRKGHRVLLLHGGDKEDVQEVNLLNGCEILVATPHCLLRMLENEKTTFDRLCHLVLDDADRLTEQFTAQVSAVMKQRCLAQAQLSKRSVPQQLLAFSSQWTLGITSFVKKYMSEPVIVITSLTEAAIFGKVRQKCVFCPVNQRRAKVLELVDPSVSQGQRIIVFVNQPDEVDELKKYLENSSLYVITAHHLMEQCILERTAATWRAKHREDSLPILVTTDQAALDLKITDATCVIHYDPPPKASPDRVQMGPRLWTMRKHFVNLVHDPKLTSQCTSYLLTTDATAPHARMYQKLLERTGATVPRALMTLALRHVEAQAVGAARPLCKKLKMFGQCRNEIRCTDRHTVVPKFDSPGADPKHITLPTEGHVKVIIMAVQEATRFMGRLLQVKDKSGKITTCDHAFLDLTLSMNMYYNMDGNKKPIGMLKKGEIYAYEDTQHTFHRCRLRQHTKPDVHGIIQKAQVHFLDRGLDDVVNAPQLFILPDHFRDIQYQAIEILPCRLEPPDLDDLTTDSATRFMSELIFNKELEGKIVLSLGNTLWLDPLEHRVNLKSMRKTTTDFSVRSELIKEGWASSNLHHLERLYALCDDNIELPPMCRRSHTTLTAHGMPMEPDVMSLGDEGAMEDVVISAVASPDLIYVRLGVTDSHFQQMQEDIRWHMEMNDSEPIETVKQNMLVLTRFPDEQRQWCRGKVVELKDTEADVFFVDTGEQEFVPQSELYALNSVFLRLPFQAIECCLCHLQPTGEEWDETVGDAIWQMSRPEDEPLRLVAKVIARDMDGEAGAFRYGINLYDTTKPYDLHFAEVLVTQGLAKIDSSGLEVLFPLDFTDDAGAAYGSIPTLCQALFSIDDSTARVEVANNIWQKVNQNRHEVEEMSESGIAVCLVNVLRYEHQPAIVDYITRALAVMAHNSDSCRDEIRRCGYISVACKLLDEPSATACHHSLIALLKALMLNTTCRSWLIRTDGVRLMCAMLRSSRPSTETLAADASYVLCTMLQANHEKEDLTAIRNSDCLATLSDMVENSSSAEIVQNCLTAMVTLTAYTTLRDAFRPAGGIKAVCSRLARSDDDPIIQEMAIKTLRALASNNRYNKEAMNEAKMIDVFKRLQKSEWLSEEVVAVCEEMYQRLVAILPSRSPQKVTGTTPRSEKKQEPLKPRPKDIKVTKSAYPDVRWSQNRRHVLLCVDVKGLDPTSQPAQVTQNSVRFRAAVDGVEYKFTFSLYELVKPQHCEVRVLGSEVQLGLTKATKGRWPALLKNKEKRIYLKVDHSRFVDSSSDDSDEHSEEEKSPLDLAKRNVTREIPIVMCDPLASKRVLTNVSIDDDDDEEEQSEQDSDIPGDDDMDRDPFHHRREDHDYHVI